MVNFAEQLKKAFNRASVKQVQNEVVVITSREYWRYRFRFRILAFSGAVTINLFNSADLFMADSDFLQGDGYALQASQATGKLSLWTVNAGVIGSKIGEVSVAWTNIAHLIEVYKSAVGTWRVLVDSVQVIRVKDETYSKGYYSGFYKPSNLVLQDESSYNSIH